MAGEFNGRYEMACSSNCNICIGKNFYFFTPSTGQSKGQRRRNACPHIRSRKRYDFVGHPRERAEYVKRVKKEEAEREWRRKQLMKDRPTAAPVEEKVESRGLFSWFRKLFSKKKG